MNVQPYLFFNGFCDEALDFYNKVLGAEILMKMRFKENPTPNSCPAGMEEKVMHASFQIGETILMASDGRCEGNMDFQGFSLTISVPDVDRAEEIFNALSDGGKIQMPLEKTFFSDKFGMVADRFGVSWMILVSE